jgi:hypothetical protein
MSREAYGRIHNHLSLHSELTQFFGTPPVIHMQVKTLCMGMTTFQSSSRESFCGGCELNTASGPATLLVARRKKAVNSFHTALGIVLNVNPLRHVQVERSILDIWPLLGAVWRQDP